MNYEKGKTYSFDGVNRVVIGFDGQGYPITKISSDNDTVDTESSKDLSVAELTEKLTIEITNKLKPQIEVELTEKLTEKLTKELADKIRLEVLAENQTTSEEGKQPSTVCPECGKHCSNGTGLSAHMRAAHNK